MGTMIPGSMADFVAAIGAPATMTIIRTYGGGRLYVPAPAKMNDAHPLARLLGLHLAMALARTVGGENREIPQAVALELAERNAEIRRRFMGGASVRQIALQLGLSTKTVWRAINGTNVPPDKG